MEFRSLQQAKVFQMTAYIYPTPTSDTPDVAMIYAECNNISM